MKFGKSFQFVIVISFFTCIIIFVQADMSIRAARITPSPAGGGTLEMRREIRKVLVTEKPILSPRAITLEAWIWLRSLPKPGEQFVILEQPGSYRLSVISKKNGKGVEMCFSYLSQGGGSGLFTDDIEGVDKWQHIAAIYTPKGIAFCRKSAFLYLCRGFFLPLGKGEKGIYIGGGFPESGRRFSSQLREVPFDGYIDEIRISDIARYSEDYKPPTAPFKPDEHTLALWHFDEGPGATQYKDASGKGNTLRWKSVKW